MSSSDASGPQMYERIADLARVVHGRVPAGTPQPQRVLDDVAAAAVQMLPGVDHAGTTVARRTDHKHDPQRLESTAATDEIAHRFDALQHQFGEGPCFDAIWEHQTVRIRDVGTEHRWPRLMPAVHAQTPIRSTLSIQLYVGGTELGALNLYSDTVDGIDGESEDAAVNLATHAAIALSSARRGEQFKSALATRDVIGQAKGILMERCDVDALGAFEMLRTLSMQMNVPIADLARRLVARDHPTVYRTR
jgi:GAF domain-containing protein